MALALRAIPPSARAEHVEGLTKKDDWLENLRCPEQAKHDKRETRGIRNALAHRKKFLAKDERTQNSNPNKVHDAHREQH